MKQQQQITGTQEDSEIIGFVPVRGLQQQQPQQSSNLGSLPVVIIAIAGMIGLSCAGSYFFAKNQNVQTQIIQAQEQAVTAERKRFNSCINGSNEK